MNSSSLHTSTPGYTLDILTDGSEYTGDGTLFLSVWKSDISVSSSPITHTDVATASTTENWHGRTAANKLLARYSVTGLGDVLARSAADQRFKMNCVKAVFCTSSTALWGLPALHMALHGAGAAELSIVSTESEKVERMLSLLESHRKNPTVHLCQVPEAPVASTDDTSSSSPSTWWKVFEDDYLLVHAQRGHVGGVAQKSSSVVFLYTLLQVGDLAQNSFLVLPPDFQPHHLTELEELPLMADNTPASLFLGVALRAQDPVESYSLPKSPAMSWYFTKPSDTAVDPGLLVRARHQSRLWNNQASDYFPLRQTLATEPLVQSSPVLRSGTSLILTTSSSNTVVREVIDRSWAPNAETHSDDGPFCTSSVQDFLRLPSCENGDENEIDLEDDDDGDDGGDNTASDTDKTSCTVKLLVLGTGCASPSPYRGASGFGLLLPHDQTVVFEVGEGFVSQWHRHAGNRSLNTIQVIWISHAHWDHYGGIVPLLTAMYNERQSRSSPGPDEHPAKRIRGNQDPPPWLIASNKVFRYLDLMLTDEPNEYFRRIPHEDRSTISRVFCSLQSSVDSFQPFAFWENVRVDHSCHSAYGFVAGLRLSVRHQGPPFVFCFSGDTRPCWRLVQACHHVAARYGGATRVDFLLHEATFDESEKEMSLAKKHSTVQEALQVARDMPAVRVLLTHFSQRYKDPLNLDGELQGKVGLALDGMLVPLFEYNL
jgi:ribonuclease BN (tRNA processing enzyme)